MPQTFDPVATIEISLSEGMLWHCEFATEP